MISKIWMQIFSACLVVATLAGACATAEDTEKSALRIVAIGDLHGDYEAYENILRAAALTDNRGRWSGGKTILVQTGDIADRGPDTRDIIEHLRKLQKQAPRKGGEVVTLVGNHEAMNMIGDLRYVHPGEYAAFADRNSEKRRKALYEANREAIETFYLTKDPAMSSDAIREAWYGEWPLGRIEHQRAWGPKGDIGEWVSANPAVVKIGDTIFLHGGISAEYSTMTIDDINAQVAAALSEQDYSETSILTDTLGPLWYRGLVRREDPADESDENPAGDTAPARPSIPEEIAMVLETYDAARIVVGHTPALSGIAPSQDGRVIQIDTGASNYYGGVTAYLEILGDVVLAHNVDTGETRTIGEPEE